MIELLQSRTLLSSLFLVAVPSSLGRYFDHFLGFVNNVYWELAGAAQPRITWWVSGLGCSQGDTGGPALLRTLANPLGGLLLLPLIAASLIHSNFNYHFA